MASCNFNPQREAERLESSCLLFQARALLYTLRPLKTRGEVRQRRGEVAGALASVGFLPGGGREEGFCGLALEVTLLFRRLDDASASELGVSAW